MASSSKVKFNLETLSKMALESIDTRIALKEVEVASYDDDGTLEAKRAEWRRVQEGRISELFSRLGGEDEISNNELAEWKLDKFPKVDYYERDKATRVLRVLKERRSQIVAKAASLSPDEDGSIYLTAVQLRDFFDL